MKKRVYNTEWKLLYYIALHENKMICLLCNIIISIIKKYNYTTIYIIENTRMTNFIILNQKELPGEHFPHLSKLIIENRYFNELRCVQ